MPLLTAITSRRRWIFLAFLGTLHLVFLQGPETPLGRLLFLTHIGVGLLWQPFIQPSRRLGFGATSLVVCVAALLALYLSWPLLLAWLFLLTGVVGGKVFFFPGRLERYFHLLAIGYLATVLLALAVPHLLASLNTDGVQIDKMVLYFAPLIFVVMALLPVGTPREALHAEFVDYIYGVLTFLLLATITLGSLSFSLLTQTDYFESLLMTLTLVAGILLLLGFIWNPRAGFGGLGGAVAQHIAALGLPVEAWLETLAAIAHREEDADKFLAQACAELPTRLPGVTGGRWRTPDGKGEFGAASAHAVISDYARLHLALDCRVSPSPSLRWHYELTARLLAEFYMGKWRAQELQRLTYVEAIHETGARLTHDVKNLLQSLETLCAAAEREPETPSPRFAALLRRQLPEIAVRLRQTLHKLAAPRQPPPGKNPPMPASEWLAALRQRNEFDWLVVKAADASLDAANLDAELFFSVVENLLQNVADKRRLAPQIRAECILRKDGDGCVLEVCDDGAAVAPEVAEELFRQRVNSENGFGIGLYQSARLAEERGYRLELADNRNGCVRFRLRPQM